MTPKPKCYVLKQTQQSGNENPDIKKVDKELVLKQTQQSGNAMAKTQRETATTGFKIDSIVWK